jgi:hypothetical protein
MDIETSIHQLQNWTSCGAGSFFCLGRALSLTFFLFFSWNIVSTQREIYTQCADAAGILLHGKWT